MYYFPSYMPKFYISVLIMLFIQLYLFNEAKSLGVKPYQANHLNGCWVLHVALLIR